MLGSQYCWYNGSRTIEPSTDRILSVAPGIHPATNTYVSISPYKHGHEHSFFPEIGVKPTFVVRSRCLGWEHNQHIFLDMGYNVGYTVDTTTMNMKWIEMGAFTNRILY